jgi:AraC-like DNA-binding protein
MEIIDIVPKSGEGILRSFDGGLVVSDHFSGFPGGRVRSLNYGIFFICTAGRAQVDYDGQTVQLGAGDLFLYFAHSVLENFMCSADFNCREIWFSRGEMWDMNMFGKNSLSDLVALKQHPKATLGEEDFKTFESYFGLLCRNLQDTSRVETRAVVHSLFSAFCLEALAIMRTRMGLVVRGSEKLHGKLLADKFMELVEQSDGRIRRVEDFAQMLNVTPKYLSKLLMKTMNRKPSEMVTLFTLKAIENRLRYSDMTMQQIADELNFSSASSFGKFVKEHLGTTPLDFRKRYHENK